MKQKLARYEKLQCNGGSKVRNKVINVTCDLLFNVFYIPLQVKGTLMQI